MKRSPLRRVSKKQAERNRIYSGLRKEFLQSHQPCAICGHAEATTVHHRGKPGQLKRGSNTNDTETWMALCFTCHRFLEDHKDWARENGYILT